MTLTRFPFQTWHTFSRGILLLIACIGTAGSSLICTIHHTSTIDETRTGDAILMLGAGVDTDGTPSPALTARVSHAANLYQQGYAPIIALTGGPVIYQRPEALVAYDMLIDYGIPPDVIVFEEVSLSTSQNVREITPLLNAHNVQSVILVTSPFHQWRARQMVEDAGFTVFASPAPDDPAQSRPVLLTWYLCREAGAWMLYELFGL